MRRRVLAKCSNCLSVFVFLFFDDALHDFLNAEVLREGEQAVRGAVRVVFSPHRAAFHACLVDVSFDRRVYNRECNLLLGAHDRRRNRLRQLQCGRLEFVDWFVHFTALPSV